MSSQSVTNIANAIINKINSLISSHNSNSNAHQDIRENIPSASSTTPSADTLNGSVGTGTTWARSNHTHPKSSLYAEASHTHSQYLTQHQSLKTINNETLVGTGNITIDIDEETEYIELSVDEEVSEYAYGNTIELYGTSTKDIIDNTTTNAKFLFKMPSISDDLGSSDIYIRLHYNNGNSYRTGVINNGNYVYRFDDAEKLSNAYVLVLLSEYNNSLMFFDIISKSNYAEASHIHSLDTLRFGNDFDNGWESTPLFTQDNDNKSVDVGGIITLDYSNNETKATYNRNLEDYSKDYYEIATIEDIGYTIRENIGEYVSAVALSNDYDDLDNKPTIPTATSDLTNDSGFITSSSVPSASSTIPSADTTSGSVGTGTAWARSDHTHPKSSLYAEASHTHSQYLTEHQSLSNYYNKSETNNYDVDFVLGTQTTSTSAWTGTTDVISSLREGTTIFYKLPYASTSTAVTLNLTLKGGGTTGAKNVFYKNTTRVTTHFGVGQVIGLTYDGTAWYVISPSDNNSNNDNNYGGIQFKAGEALTTQTICCAKIDGMYYKVANGVVLDIRYPLIMTSSAVASGTTTNAMYRTWYGVNIANTKSMTLTNGSQLFLEGTAYSDGKFTISSNIVTHTLTNGRYYIKVGTALSTTQIRFISDMTVYYYNGTTLKPAIKKDQIVDFPTIPSKTSQITDSSAYANLGTSSNATQQTINNAIERNALTIRGELDSLNTSITNLVKIQYIESGLKTINSGANISVTHTVTACPTGYSWLWVQRESFRATQTDVNLNGTRLSYKLYNHSGSNSTACYVRGWLVFYPSTWNI